MHFTPTLLYLTALASAVTASPVPGTKHRANLKSHKPLPPGLRPDWKPFPRSGGTLPGGGHPRSSTRTRLRDPSGKCNTGRLQCCQQTIDPHTAEGRMALTRMFDGSLGGLIGGNLDALRGLVGTGCLPMDVLGSSDTATVHACSTSAVCCERSVSGGLINVGCMPIVP